jgi:hypothetical protein
VPTLADILRAHGEEYLRLNEDRVLPSQAKAMRDIVRCRSPDMEAGGIYACPGCGQTHYAYNSCGNRHCPACGNDKTDEWLADRMAQLLPVDYYLITCTLAHEVNPTAFAHQRTAYGAFFRASSEAIVELALDRRLLGARLGMTGVLQTWRRDMEYHVHTHFLIPGGGVASDGRSWRYPRNKDFLLPEKPLARLLRGKFRDAMRAAGLHDQIPPEAWRKEWVVDCANVGDGRRCLKYMAPYIHRVALTNRRITALEDGEVSFEYKPSGADAWKIRTLPALRFIAVFLQHVLPKGFMKVRHYGFLASAAKKTLKTLQLLVLTCRSQPPQPVVKPQKQLKCFRCGGPLQLVLRFFPLARGPPTT